MTVKADKAAERRAVVSPAVETMQEVAA